MAFAVIVQQLISASSLIFLSNISEVIDKRESDVFIPMLYFFLSLILPYIPGAISLVALKLWENDIQFTTLNKFISLNRNKPIALNDKELRQEKESALSKEIPNFSLYISGFSFDILACVLSMLFNILLIGLVLDLRFIWTFAIALLLVSILLRYSNQVIAKGEAVNQSDRITYTKHLINFWESNIIGNKSILKNWSKTFAQDFKVYEKNAGNLEAKKQIISLLIVGLVFIPMMLLSLFILKESSNDIAKVILLVGIIPRLFSVLGNTHHLLSLIATIPMYKQMFEGISNFATKETTACPKKRIKSELIQINDELLTEERIRQLNQLEQGRITIKGPNGAGKSTFLMSLKANLGENAFYMPAKDSQYYNKPHSGSSGQLIKSKILEVINEGYKYLLLDEWDANLDVHNRNELNEVLEKLSHKICVLEVRH